MNCPNCGVEIMDNSTFYQHMGGHAPRYQLPDRRSLAKMFFLGLLTGGIYNMAVYTRIPEELNMVASRHDGKRTQQFFWMLLLTVMTCGVYGFVWCHNLSDRIGDELRRRGISYRFDATTFWLWDVLGALLVGIGPFVYIHKLCKAMNHLNRDYNING